MDARSLPLGEESGRELIGDPPLVLLGFPSAVSYEREKCALAGERPDHVGGLAGR